MVKRFTGTLNMSFFIFVKNDNFRKSENSLNISFDGSASLERKRDDSFVLPDFVKSRSKEERASRNCPSWR